MLRATDLQKIASLLTHPPPNKRLNDNLKKQVSDIKLNYPLFAFFSCMNTSSAEIILLIPCWNIMLLELM